MRLRKKLVVICLMVGTLLGAASPAAAWHELISGGRADGVCGGHRDPITGECG